MCESPLVVRSFLPVSDVRSCVSFGTETPLCNFLSCLCCGNAITICLTPPFLGYVRRFSTWQTGIAFFSTGLASLVGTSHFAFMTRRVDLPSTS
jgi:DHA2 family multidrug resistance protein